MSENVENNVNVNQENKEESSATANTSAANVASSTSSTGTYNSNNSNYKKNRYQRNNYNRNYANGVYKKRVCKLCAYDNVKPSYKNPESLKRFISERGKILSSRITGTCAKHQRYIAKEIKRARILAYLPFDRK